MNWSDLAAALPWTALGVVAVLGTAFLAALRLGRHAVVDVAWGLGFVAVAGVAFALSADAGDGTRRLLLLVLVTLWGVRLAAHIAWRSRGHGEDPRYEAMLSRAPGSRTLYAVQRIYLTQAVFLWFISLPVQVGMFQDAAPGWLLWLGVAVWAVGFFFESVGDWQLHRFRSDPASRGRVLDTGLWRYTRHPNYFGDATAWWGLFLIAADGGAGWVTALSPVVMTWLLAKGTGAALLEKDIHQRRPEYVDYVRRTSGFVPWFPKKTHPTR